MYNFILYAEFRRFCRNLHIFPGEKIEKSFCRTPFDRQPQARREPPDQPWKPSPPPGCTESGVGATRPPSARRLSSAVNLRPVAGPPRRLGGGRRAPRRASRPISAESRDARQQVGNWRGSRRRPLRGAGSRAAGFRSPFSFAEVRETTTALVGCDLCNPVRLFDEARAKGLQIRFSLCADQKRSICGSSLNFQSKRLDMVRGFSWACYDFYENINCFSHLLLM